MQTHNTPIYLKAITLRDMSDIPGIKDDAKKHMILILRVTPLAQKDVVELRKAIEDLTNTSSQLAEILLDWEKSV